MATSSLKTYIGLLTAALAIGGSVMLVTESTMAQPAAHGRMDPARMDKMVEMRVERMAKEVNATPEQKAKLLAIAKTAQTDIKPMHDQIRARMEKAMADIAARQGGIDVLCANAGIFPQAKLQHYCTFVRCFQGFLIKNW